jgi:hypothetical protein
MEKADRKGIGKHKFLEDDMEPEQDAGMTLAKQLLEGITPRIDQHAKLLKNLGEASGNHQEILTAQAVLLDILVLAVRDLQIRVGIDPIEPPAGAVN